MGAPRTKPYPKPYVKVDRRKQGNTHGPLASGKPLLVVLHDTECGDRAGAADVIGVLQYLERTPDRLGVHFVVDAEGIIGQGAGLLQMCYHARGVNDHSVGIEQIGFARFELKTWLKRRAQRRKVAMILAYLSEHFGIPLEHSVKHGVCLHRDIPAGGHSDPGRHYPLNRTLKLARKYLKVWHEQGVRP